MLTFSSDTNTINWDKAARIFELAPLGTREPVKLKRAFENSFSKIFVYNDEKLIGLARAISDGEYQAAIYDVALLPDFQSKGIGKQIIEKLIETLPVENIILYAVPGKDRFYKKCGFKKMLTAYAKLNIGMSDPTLGYLINE